MPMNVATTTFGNGVLVPIYGDENPTLCQAINIPVSTVIAHGTVLGQVTTSANDVQTITMTGTPTGGTFTWVISGIAGVGNFVLPFNATATVAQGLLAAIVGSGNVTVTGGPMPGSTLVVTYTGALAKAPVPLMTAGTNALTGGSSPTSTVAHTTVGVTAGTFAAYASGNSDGTQVATCIAKYDMASDAAGNITYGSAATGGQWGESYNSAPAYFAGYFRTEQLVGLDATSIASLGRLISGTSTKGILKVN